MKKILFLVMMCVITLNAMGQATSLVVDNQTPGWLSSKINYSDQKTVVNLKLKGYLNQTDINFIQNLIINKSLSGVLDMNDVQIVSDDGKEDGNLKLEEWGLYYKSLKHFICPESLNSLLIPYLKMDTITFPKWKTLNQEFSMRAKVIIFRDGLVSIPNYTFSRSYPTSKEQVLTKVELPNSIRSIGDEAFFGCTSLQNVNLNDSINYIGWDAFRYTKAFAEVDTIKLPKALKKYYIQSLIYPYNKDLTVYIPNSVSNIWAQHNVNRDNNDAKVCWHLTNSIPPTLSYQDNDDVFKKYFIIYVPKSLLAIYKSNDYWAKLNLQADSTCADNISISEEKILMNKGDTTQLSANIRPLDAYTQDIKWYSKNTSIASVSDSGKVSSISAGSTYIYAYVSDIPNIKDSCLVIVRPSVSSLSLTPSEKTIKVGESFNIIANVLPYDADNKNIMWKSSDENIAEVVDGKVKGKKAGEVNIIATSVSDTTIRALCKVTVLQPVEGISLDKSTVDLNAIGETMQLTATVIPDDASNKTVNWRSSDEKVCLVANGKVLAVGYGTAVIIATTDDGGYMASCTVNVNNTTGVNGLTINKDSSYKIYTVDGKQISRLQKGVNIIRFNNGISKLIINND